ncbi:MAG: trehalase family glycosidase [Bacteroidota bacterium]|nr:trehalase family glycosidase [Bacteroidota bacterium]
MKRLNVLKYLERNDKWYLGGGNRLLWAPAFPVWLDYPGFWDKAHYYNYEIEPVFTWTILDEDGVEIPLRGVEREWNPSKLTTRFQMLDVGYQSPKSEIRNPKSDLSFNEDKCCLPNDVLASVIKVRNKLRKKRKIHLIAWTIQPSRPSKKNTWISDVKVEKSGINFTKHTRHIHQSNTPLIRINCSFGLNRKMKSYSINLSEGSTSQPHWRLTPFVEKFMNGKLPNEIKLKGVNNDGLIFMALHMSLELRVESEESVSIFFGAAPTRNEVKKNITTTRKMKNPIAVSEKSWNEYFSSVPYFECSDEYLTRYYWYRWYGLKLNTIDTEEGNYKHPFVCEGIGYFRAPISYSSPCHMLENRWRHDPKLAQGSLLTFIENQRNDGGFRGYIGVNYYRQEKLGVSPANGGIEPFYHANWGNAVRELYQIHPDKIFLKKAYNGLVKYVRYFDRERDKEKSGLYDIDNHYETGQEYMHRYLAVDPNADMDNWGKVFRLKGVDVTIYIYELKQALGWMSKELNLKNGGMDYWINGAEKIKRAVLEKMWDPKEEMFFDLNPKTGKRTKVKAAVCFYPYFTDIVSKIHVSGLKRHLLNPKEFWIPYPVPSSGADDKYFSAEPEWKGKRMNCPWNGRVWPMTNSHSAEVLAQTAIRFNSKELRAKSVEFISQYIKMMFYHGDSKRPNCFEHYNSFTGQPSIYRGVDDYQHSWVVDLIIKYVAGIRVSDKFIIVDPFLSNLKWFKMEKIFIRGIPIHIELKDKNYIIWWRGRKLTVKKNGEPSEIKIC